jgi:tRNA(fMet)-specific endonuclease VapC
MHYFLDTNICIYLIKKRPLSVVQQLQSLEIHQVAISSITLSELEFGVAKSQFPEKNKFALAQFLAPISILPFEEKAAECYGKVRVELQRKGQPIGSMDMLIAAHAIASEATLVTNNVREFERVEGLKVENWVE